MRWFLLAVIALGCSSKQADAPAAQESFIAFEHDFQGFRTWQKSSFAETSDAFPAHLGGPRDVYLNKAPPHGSTEFPVGTIIVKEVLDGGPFTDRIIFARVKRGGGYNPDANGWEWFQLNNRADGSTGITWRGVGPPDGDNDAGTNPAYQGHSDGCAPCHKGGASNDMVLAPSLQLSSF